MNGELLRFLRTSFGYTQEQVATLASVSDKLVRKAEAGGSLQPTSIRALADVYQQPRDSLTKVAFAVPPNVKTKEEARAETTGDAQLTLASLLRESWTTRKSANAARLLADEVICHHDRGVLVGRQPWCDRLATFHQEMEVSFLNILQIAGDYSSAASRWRLIYFRNQRTPQIAFREGSTMIRMQNQSIVQIVEHFDPTGLPISKDRP